MTHGDRSVFASASNRLGLLAARIRSAGGPYTTPIGVMLTMRIERLCSGSIMYSLTSMNRPGGDRECPAPRRAENDYAAVTPTASLTTRSLWICG